MISIGSLNQISGLEALRFRAGLQGSKNAIRWPYIAENTEIENWTKGGELIFVTGLNWKWTVQELITLIEKAKKQCTSGLVILTHSPYLDTIPIEVLDFANEQLFPIFEQPYSLPMVNVTEILSNAIIMDGLNNKSNRWFLRNLADTPSMSEIDLNKATEIGLNPDQQLSVAFIKFNRITDEEVIKGDYLISQFMLNEGVQLPITELHQGWLAIMPTSAEYCDDSMKRWNQLHQKLLAYGFHCTIGVSDAKELKVIYKAVSQARQSAKFHRDNDRNEVIHYNSLGIAQLFTHVDNNEIESFCRQYLGDIFNKHDTQSLVLKTTLVCYFDNLCSMRQTALAMNIHRNTLSNRLQKIETLTGINLSYAQQRLSLQIALIAARFIS